MYSDLENKFLIAFAISFTIVWYLIGSSIVDDRYEEPLPDYIPREEDTADKT
jgi:hypothetical protein